MANDTTLKGTGGWFVAAGLLLVGRAAVELTDPAYYNPVTLLDYAAAYGTTIAWVTAGVGLFMWWRTTPIRRGAFFLFTAAIGMASSGIGNLIEDVVRVDFGELLFVYGGMLGAISLILASLAALSANSPYRWSGLFLLAFVAGSTFPDNGGEFLGGAALIGLGLWLHLAWERQAGVDL